MKRILLLAFCTAAFSAPATASTHAPKEGKVDVSRIVARNVAVRGGLKAWKSVNTLTLSGKLEAGGKQDPELPFVMKMKRPHKSRLEISFHGQTAVQVYDGEHGWKLRPFLGRDDAEPYTAAEARDAKSWQELDGPLVDYAAKGTRISYLGTEKVEGHKTYKLKLTLKDGDERHVWIDAHTFLERKIDGEPRKLDGKLRNVTVYFRDYKREKGLVMPHVLESAVEGGRQSHKLYIDRVAVNQPMDDTLFLKPNPDVVVASDATAERRP